MTASGAKRRGERANVLLLPKRCRTTDSALAWQVRATALPVHALTVEHEVRVGHAATDAAGLSKDSAAQGQKGEGSSLLCISQRLESYAVLRTRSLWCAARSADERVLLNALGGGSHRELRSGKVREDVCCEGGSDSSPSALCSNFGWARNPFLAHTIGVSNGIQLHETSGSGAATEQLARRANPGSPLWP